MTESRANPSMSSVQKSTAIEDDVEIIKNDNNMDVKPSVNYSSSDLSSKLCQKCITKEIQNNVSVEDMTSHDYQYDYYAHIGLHENMLKDEVRTLTYRDSIIRNKHLFKNKIVLDIGCGTGILSMFAAKSGAKHVIGIDCSAIFTIAKQIVRDNNLSDKITLIKGRVEEIELPKEYPKVDIIISEWMGYCLFYESMLNTVIYARDKWLNPGGMLFPDKCSLHIAAFDVPTGDIEFWDDVYGFDMSSIGKGLLKQALVDEVDPKYVVTTNCMLKDFDLYTIKAEDLTFKSNFQLEVKRDDFIKAFVVYFDIEFTKCHTKTGFSTSPDSMLTHWEQTYYFIDDYLTVKTGEEIYGTFEMMPSSESFDIDFNISVHFMGELSEIQKSFEYKLI